MCSYRRALLRVQFGGPRLEGGTEYAIPEGEARTYEGVTVRVKDMAADTRDGKQVHLITVRDERAARMSIAWASTLVGLLTTALIAAVSALGVKLATG